ncbi:MAG: YraN family protein [Anaerolineae bacterium]
MNTKDTGTLGERYAAQYLEQKGYTILHTNWRWPHGEVDIIARQGETLVFVEVRTRHAPSTESAFASLSPEKQTKMIHGAYAYIKCANLPEDTLWRVDAIAVALVKSMPIIDHVEDALGW